MTEIPIPCVLYRGGSSRGLLFLEEHLPYPRPVVERLLLRMFGSPDVRQIDGAGGATSLTSKAIIVGADPTGRHDVRMTFAQVAVNAPTVDWGGNCGNMTSAVGPFAIEAQLVPAVEPITIVNIRSENTGSIIRAHVPVRDGKVLVHGDYTVAGVPGSGARLDLEWLNPQGSICGRLLPTGNPVDQFVLADGRRIDVSLVDGANPVVFCEARSIGLFGDELPPKIESQPGVMQALEEIRSIAAEIMGIVPHRSLATITSPGLPKVAIVAARKTYRTTGGELVDANAHDLQARLLSMQTAHRSYAGAGAITTAIAALISGTIVYASASRSIDTTGTVRIAHPAGLMAVDVLMEAGGGQPRVTSARVGRTARRIMSGQAWVPSALVQPV